MEQSELGERLERYFKEKYWPVEIRKIFVSTKILMWNSSERKACMLLKYFIPTFSKPTYVFWRLEMSFVLLCFSALLQCKHKKIKTEMKPEKKKKVLVNSWELQEPQSLFVMGSEISALTLFRQPQMSQTEKILGETRKPFLTWLSQTFIMDSCFF